MKSYIKIIIPIALLFLFADVQAQKKKATAKKTVTSNKVAPKAVEKNFGNPTSISQITDITEADPAYGSLKSLIEKYNVSIAYDDNTFRGKDLLKRGEFVVALNSGLINLKKAMDDGGLDTSLFNTYDRNRGGAYLTGINQIKDVPENSIYYPASKSLIERWGIGEPFSLGKTLNAGSTISEKEVYDVLRVTLGYNSAGINPYSEGMSRSKFAIVLNNAFSQKMTEISYLNSAKQEIREADRRHQLDSLQKVDMARKDSVAKEIELRKQEAAKREAEARTKLKQKNK